MTDNAKKPNSAEDETIDVAEQDARFLGTFDPAERAREKQASRDADARALLSGEKTRAQLKAENGAFAFPRARIRFSKREH